MSEASQGPRVPPRPSSAQVSPPTPAVIAAPPPGPRAPAPSPAPLPEPSRPSSGSNAAAPGSVSRKARQGSGAEPALRPVDPGRAGSGASNLQHGTPAAPARSAADPAGAASPAHESDAHVRQAAEPSAAAQAKASATPAAAVAALTAQPDAASSHPPDSSRSQASSAAARNQPPPHQADHHGAARAASLRTQSPPKVPAVHSKATSSSTATDVRTEVSQASSGSFINWLPGGASGAQSTDPAHLGPSASQAAHAPETAHDARHPSSDAGDVGPSVTELVQALNESELGNPSSQMHRSISPRVLGLQQAQLSGSSADGSRQQLHPHESWLRDAADSAGSQSGPDSTGQPSGVAGSLTPAPSGPASGATGAPPDVYRQSTEPQRESTTGNSIEFKFSRSDALRRRTGEEIMDDMQVTCIAAPPSLLAAMK